MPVIDVQVHPFDRNHPGRPWASPSHGLDSATGEEMVVAMNSVGVDGAIMVSSFSAYEYDPSYAAIYGPYTAMINDYTRSELKYENDIPYEILTSRVRPWNYGTAQNRYVNVAETLRGAMSQNQFLKVFVAAGYYDFATPFYAAEYTFNHLQLDPALTLPADLAKLFDVRP